MKILYFIFIKVVFFAFVFLITIGCERNDDHGCIDCDTAPEWSKSDLQYIGLTIVSHLEKTTDDPEIYILGLTPHARPFTLEEHIVVQDDVTFTNKSYQKTGTMFLQLLKESEENFIPVKVYVFPKSSNIGWVDKATNEEIRNFNEKFSMSNPTSR